MYTAYNHLDTAYTAGNCCTGFTMGATLELDSLVHYIDLKREITVNVVYFLHVEVFCIKINNILKMIIIELSCSLN